MSGNFTVITNEEAELFRKLKKLYEDVCDLTINHDILSDHAVVYPSKLGPALSEVDVNWHFNSNKVN